MKVYERNESYFDYPDEMEKILTYLNERGKINVSASIDWKIRRRLDEAWTVYLTLPRGSDKIRRQLELYSELFESGKKLVLVDGYDFFFRKEKIE